MFNIDKATLQEAVDYSVQMIVKQGIQSVAEPDSEIWDANNTCVYDNGKGQHCAIGWLLDPDDKEQMSCNGGVNLLITDFGHKIPDLIRSSKLLFVALQAFHDRISKKERGTIRTAIGKDYGIDVTGVWFQQWVDLGTEYSND